MTNTSESSVATPTSAAVSVSEMRKAGIEGIDRVRWAVLEPDGKLSFIASDDRQRPPKEDEAAAL